MDHGTFCISCHTGLPYALARPVLRGSQEKSQAERILLDSVTRRVQMWKKVSPYLGDKNAGLNTESVINALVLASEDAPKGRMSETTREALRIMWTLQRTSGDFAGAWPWANFGNEPWEAPDSEYWGATLAAAAVGIAPEGYSKQPQIQEGLKALKSYLIRGERDQSPINRLALLWADAKAPGLLTHDRRAAILADILARQRSDGGWNTPSLLTSSWRRHDGRAQDEKSDGYATGFAAFVLGDVGVSPGEVALNLARARAWLSDHQDRTTGAWPTDSPNSVKDPATDQAKFMTDAATAYAVAALSRNH